MDEYRDEPHDDPAAAFERLRGEVSLLRVAIEGLTTARESIEIPDYEPTLARTERVLTVLTEQLEPIVESPALTLTPYKMAQDIAGAATAARREDERLLTEARKAFDQATREIGNRLASERRGDEQRRRVYLFGFGGLVLGALLWMAFAGGVARSAPASWQWPERMAARTLRMEMWEGGQRMMKTALPESYAAIAAGDQIVTANRDTLVACRKAATKAKKLVHCTIEVKASE